MAYAPLAVFTTGSLPPPFHFGNLNTVKLSLDNYTFWRAQVLPLLGSHYLLGYIDGSLPCPPALVNSVNGPVYNPAHRVWMGQDQANLSSIQGSLTPAIAGLIVFAKTSHGALPILERSFASQALASALHRELGDCEKFDSTAMELYNKVKALAETLVSIGQPLTDSEINSFIVNGLNEEYDGLVISTHFYSCRHLLGLQVQRFVEQQQVSLKWITQGLSNSGRKRSKLSLSSNPAITIQKVSCVPNTPNTLVICIGALVWRRDSEIQVV
jgi:hypothetical protein